MNRFLALLAAACMAVAARADTYLVLPFFNASHTANLDWIGESISEGIRGALSYHGLMTLSRDDRQEAFRRLGLRADANLTRATVMKIGQALDANQVVYGEFEFQPPPPGDKSRGSLKIVAHVLDLRALRQGPEFSEIASLDDLAAEQARIAWETLRYLTPKGAPSEEEFRRQRTQIRVDAMESYIRGLLASNADQKYRLFSQAVRLEPGYSEASFELGMLAYSREDYRAAADWFEKVSPAMPRRRKALFYLGICRFESGAYAAAETAFRTVAETVPLNEVWNNLGAAQSRLNRAQATDNFVKALEGDSSDPVYHFNVGYSLWRQKQFDSAAERFRAVLDRTPEDSVAAALLAKCRGHQGPQPNDPERLERLKTQYEESAYWQLKAVLQPDKQ